MKSNVIKSPFFSRPKQLLPCRNICRRISSQRECTAFEISSEENSLRIEPEFGAFGLHPIDDRTRYVRYKPVAHLVINNRLRCVGAHAARVGAFVIIQEPFVVLARDER